MTDKSKKLSKRSASKFSVDRAELHEVARQLIAIRPAADIDVIDGAFYWDCCRQEYAERVKNILPTLPKRSPARELSVYENGYLDEFGDRFGLTKLETFHRLVRDGNIRHRAPNMVTHCSSSNPMVIESVTFNVGSARIDGAQFAMQFMEWFEFEKQVSHREGYRYFGSENGEVKELRILFKRSFDGYVSVNVPLPIPAPEVLASAYEFEVFRNSKWVSHFPDRDLKKSQTSEVAIRTWVVGLLLGSGEPWAKAIYTASESYGCSEIDKSQFTRERATLLKRVPEARPYLMQR